HLRELRRLVHRPVLLRRETEPPAVRPAALVGTAERGGRRPGGRDESRTRDARVEERLLERRDVRLVDQLVVDRGDRVLPQLRFRNVRAEVARHRPHVAVEELVPRLRERLCELVRMLEEAPRDLLVLRVEPQREIRRQHPGGGAVPVRALLAPLLRAGRALRQLPLVREEVLEEAVAPRRRRLGPRHLEAARDRVAPLAGAVATLPAEPLLLDRRRLRLRADLVGGAGAVRLR